MAIKRRRAVIMRKVSRRKWMQGVIAAAAVGVLRETRAADKLQGQSDARWPEYEFRFPPRLIYDCEPERKFCREAVLRRMPDGSLVSLIYSGGQREPSNENVMLGTRSTDDGQTWSKPEVIFQHPQRGVYAAELWVEDGLPTVFLQTFVAASRYLEMRAYQSSTSDSGRTWGEPVSLPGVGGCFLVRRGILLHDKTRLMPVYWTEQRAKNNWTWEKRRPNGDVEMSNWIERCGVLRSTDRGATYTSHGYLHANCPLLEPACVELAPGRVLMLMRAERQGRFYRAESADGGMTWSSAEPSDIPAVASKVLLLKYQSAVLMLFNPPSDGAEGDGLNERRQLSLWVSYDGCRTWPKRQTLARVLPRPGLPAWKAVCYPDGFVDQEQRVLFATVDNYRQQFLLRIPLAEIL
jgi:predicted neuraminidase